MYEYGEAYSDGQFHYIYISFKFCTVFSVFKIKFLFCFVLSIDCHGPDPGSQATFYGSRKITVLIWPVTFSKGLSALDI